MLDFDSFRADLLPAAATSSCYWEDDWTAAACQSLGSADAELTFDQTAAERDADSAGFEGCSGTAVEQGTAGVQPTSSVTEAAGSAAVASELGLKSPAETAAPG